MQVFIFTFLIQFAKIKPRENFYLYSKTEQWRSQYRGKGGQSALLDCKLSKSGKRGKNWEKERKIRKKSRKEEKSGRKGQNRKSSFTLPLLTNRAGYATANEHILPIFLINFINILAKTIQLKYKESFNSKNGMFDLAEILDFLSAIGLF